ncbi:hypothetical protein BS50DRAFT_538474, partial [Corynespora cassiicola Philippines]
MARVLEVAREAGATLAAKRPRGRVRKRLAKEVKDDDKYSDLENNSRELEGELVSTVASRTWSKRASRTRSK